jgi:uracil-DNA glycosylase
MDAAGRGAELLRLSEEWRSCTRCALAEGRTQVVVGAGDLDADLMFVGQAGKLLSTLLEEIGLSREAVYIANVLKCRPPGNRDPRPEEIEACEGYLFTQVAKIRPRVICTLGNFATKLLSGRPEGITRVHGRPRPHRIGDVEVNLYPIYHPAAALYTPRMLDTLREDFSRLPELLRDGPAPPPRQPAPAIPVAPPPIKVAVAVGEPEPAQLGLF